MQLSWLNLPHSPTLALPVTAKQDFKNTEVWWWNVRCSVMKPRLCTDWVALGEDLCFYGKELVFESSKKIFSFTRVESKEINGNPRRDLLQSILYIVLLLLPLL